MSAVVVVGASLAGLRSADSLLRAGFSGKVTVVGEEPHFPYNRPPLSKEALVEGQALDDLRLRSSSAPNSFDLRLGVSVLRADMKSSVLQLSDGTTLDFDGLIAATGLRSRALRIPKPESGVLALRNWHDLIALRDALKDAPQVAIVGAGFIGCELAASLTALGHEVSVIAPEQAPMLRPLGIELGSAIGRRHQANGVRFGLGRLPVEIVGEDRPSAVVCDDGSSFDAQLVIEAVGSISNVEWLQGNDLDLSDGLLCNERLQFDTSGRALAVGDIARFPNRIFDDVPRRVEHWGIAVDSGRYGGRAMAEILSKGQSEKIFTPMPAFWSDQFDLRIQSFGMPGLVTDPNSIRVLEGNVDSDVAIGYFRDDIMVGVVLIGFTQSHMKYRAMVESSLIGN